MIQIPDFACLASVTTFASGRFTTRRRREFVDRYYVHIRNWQDDQLGDAVSALHDERFGRIGVEQCHQNFAAVARVDQAGRVHDRNPVPGRRATARQHKPRVAFRQSDSNPGRHV